MFRLFIKILFEAKFIKTHNKKKERERKNLSLIAHSRWKFITMET